MLRQLRNIVAAFIGQLFNCIGLVNYAKKRFTNGSILPLFFHNPNEKVFKRLIEWLIENEFILISTAQLVDIIHGKMDLRQKAVWISFDDGWQPNIQNVIPTLLRYNVPATFFLTTTPIESNEGVFWFSLVRANRRYLPSPYYNKVDNLWFIPESERKKIVATLEKGPHIRLPREAMTISEVKKIAQLPQITIGCHTVDHGLMTNCTDIELETEIRDAKNKIETWIGKEVKYFSFPKGVVDSRTDNILKRCDFMMAATIEELLINPQSGDIIDIYRIPRYAILDDAYFSEVICHVVGIWQPFIRRVKATLGFDANKVYESG